MRTAPTYMSSKNSRRILAFLSCPSVADRSLLTTTVAVLLGACGSIGGSDAPPAKESAKLEISIKADTEVNQNTSGKGAPILLRVYELKSDIAFQDADFFALQHTDKAALGADLLAVDQFILRPGETRKIMRKTNPETAFIGIFAGYRDLPNSTWRVVHRLLPAPDKSWYRVVIPANKVRLQIELQSNAIQMVDEDADTQPAPYANESMKALESFKVDDMTQRATELLKPSTQAPNFKDLIKPPTMP